MIKNFLSLIFIGIFWLYIFAIPYNNKRVFDLGYDYLVNNKPIHWLSVQIGDFWVTMQEKNFAKMLSDKRWDNKK